MKIKTIIVVIISVFFLSVNTHAETEKDFSIHGIKLGMDMDSLSEEYPDFECNTDPSNPDIQRCKGEIDPTAQSGVFEKLRGTSIKMTLVFVKEKLVNINIPFYRALFKPTSHFFIQHYGQPKASRKAIKNQSGKEQANTVLVWRNGNESIIYWEIDEGRYTKTDDNTYSRILFILKEK